MKHDLPEDHGLSTVSLQHLVPRDEDQHVSLTDVQHDSLTLGAARGESLLIVSPTSTGKTLIGTWALVHSIESGTNAVYLVTHRALAKQKFDELKHMLLTNFLAESTNGIVLATGDSVTDAAGDVPADPLHAPVLVATYEKYLAMLAAAGIPSDMSRTVIVCDEIQLIGDPTRGQSVELLLTLLERAGWKQFVGLSAVLEERSSRDVAEWLGIRHLRNSTREKHLKYECWTEEQIHSMDTARGESEPVVSERPAQVDLDPIEVLSWLLSKRAPRPIIVFCMSKKQTYEYAERYEREIAKSTTNQMSLLFGNLPETNASNLLARYIPNKFAIHNADLTEDERHIVERSLADDKIDVIFSTSTLAAGVNFPLGTALFASWERWNPDRRTFEPIESTEFHNMAGRVGRMGTEHKAGRIVFLVTQLQKMPIARRYLDFSAYQSIATHISPLHFEQLSLQLVGAGLATTRSDLLELFHSTLSGAREREHNFERFKSWSDQLNLVVTRLLESKFLIESSKGKLIATPIGRVTAQSGLQPTTASFLGSYIAERGDDLVKLLPSPNGGGNLEALAFAIFHACLSSPEFRPFDGARITRQLPYPLEQSIDASSADRFKELLWDSAWLADHICANAAQLALDWTLGKQLRELEVRFPALSAGMLRELFRNLGWVLQGLAAIITTASDAKVPPDLRPDYFQLPDGYLNSIRRLPRIFGRLAYRVAVGLPDEVLWMNHLDVQLTRQEILRLRELGIVRPESAMLGDKKHDDIRTKAFERGQPSPQARANAFRDSAKNWKQEQRKYVREKHQKRAAKCPRIQLVQRYYGAVGTDFENVFEEVLQYLGIAFQRLDTKGAVGAPDYLLKFKDGRGLVVELKTREQERLVDYNKATEVLAASEVHGHKDKFCITLCHPGVDPSVPNLISACGRLAVVESTDFGEALLRLCERTLDESQFADWLETPGQALATDLPFVTFYV